MVCDSTPMTRIFLAGILLTACVTTPVLRAQQQEQPSLAELARRTEEARRKAAEQKAAEQKPVSEAAKKAGPAQKADTAVAADKAETSGTADKTDESKSKKVYTNSDLVPLGGSTGPTPGVTAASSAAGDPGPVPKTETEEMKARRVLKFELDRIAFKIRDWAVSTETFLKMCDKGSFLGLKGGALEGHRKFCMDDYEEIQGKEANIDQLVNELQDAASKQGILPGTARDLVKAMGWK